MTTPISRRVLSRARMLDFLDEMAKTPGAEARSLYLPPGLPPDEAEIFLKEHALGIPTEVSGLAGRSKTGAVFFLTPEQKYLALPPFPIAEKYAANGLAVAPLQSLLKHNYRLALVLVRLGSYAIGVVEGEKLVNSKVGTGLVHGRHRQGGSSAHRFERHRDKQIEYFLTRVCQHARENIEPQAKALDYVVYGGAWTTIQLLQKQCPFLGRLDKPTLPPLLDIPEPRQAVLATAIGRIWSSMMLAWKED